MRRSETSGSGDPLRVVVTGATSGVGASAIEALAEREEVGEIVGLARRCPAWRPEKTRWVRGDVVNSPLEPIFERADAVVHLAWATRPSHDGEALERINLEGSRRVFDAVVAAGVPKLVHASSVGAYSPGPRDRLIAEDWPTGGIPSSSYSLHKAAVERMLDELDEQGSERSVVRLRPALIFEDEAAIEIRRLFAAPFLPGFLLRSRLLRAIPRLPGLCFQAVHSSDVGRALSLATVRDVEGAFNIAAPPTLDGADLASALDARTFPLSVSLAKRLADLSWRLRLQPTPAGWLDMAMEAPLMSVERAARELEWEPRVCANGTLAEPPGGGRTTMPLAGGARQLEEAPAPGRVEAGAQRSERRLIAQLGDLQSIEAQALAQMRSALEIAGTGRLGRAFEEHLAETESQERRVRERLEAHVETSRPKRREAKPGGVGMVVFAESRPDTPARLVAHAYAYEHMEIAAYRMLGKEAREAGDAATSALAAEIADEEEAMALLLEECFDDAVEASLGGAWPSEPEALLDRHLADAHAIEKQGMQLLEMGWRIAAEDSLRDLFAEHLGQSEAHAEMVWERLEARAARPSRAGDALLRIGGMQAGAFFAAQPETTARLRSFAFAFEHLEVATYELLARTAARAGDRKVAAIAKRIAAEERAVAGRLGSRWSTSPRPGPAGPGIVAEVRYG